MNFSELSTDTLVVKDVSGLDLDKIERECKELAKSRAKVSAGVAIVPIPFLDVAVDVGMLRKLLPQITERFGLEDKDTALAREKISKKKCFVWADWLPLVVSLIKLYKALAVV